MDIRIESQKVEIRAIIECGINTIFNEAQDLIGVTSGDIDPSDAVKLEVSTNSIESIVLRQLEANLPIIPLSKEVVMAMFKAPKQVLRIDYGDFNELIERAYGGSYEIVAEEELNNGSICSFSVPNKNMNTDADRQRIRRGEYKQYELHAIVTCLYDDGFLEAGEYEVMVSW